MLISKKAAGITPYIAGEQPQSGGWIKLNTNENPYPPTAYSALKDPADLRLYPDPNATELKQAIAELHGLSPQNVFVGNGSDEVLAIAFQALFDAQARPIAAPDISYSFYPVYASLYDVNYCTVAVNQDFAINVDDYNGDYGGIVLANPNAPTSIALKKEEVCRLVNAHREIPVIIDEAYVDFCEESVADEVKRLDNLLVVRTLSKSYSLAGLRLGYALGSAQLVEAMERIKNCFNSYTVDRIAQQIALEAIKDQPLMRQHSEMIISTRRRSADQLTKLGFSVLPSSANFLFARHETVSGKEIFEALKSRKILVRRWDAPKISDYLRITIGTDAEMDCLLQALKEILQR